MTELTAVMGQVEAAGRRPFDAVIEKVADALGARAGAKAVFGEPVERDGVTVIPVAKVRWGFGAGSGGSVPSRGNGARSDGASGEGAGGGVMGSPLGYIVIRDGAARFEPIVDPVAYWPLVLAGAVASWILLRGIRSLLRR